VERLKERQIYAATISMHASGLLIGLKRLFNSKARAWELGRLGWDGSERGALATITFHVVRFYIHSPFFDLQSLINRFLSNFVRKAIVSESGTAI